MHNFRELKVWEKAMLIVENTYVVSALLPDSEKFNFLSQMNRSALSIPSSIAKGAGRETNKEFCRFLDIAIGSSYELETQSILASRIFNIGTEELIRDIQEVQRMLFTLKKVMSKNND